MTGRVIMIQGTSSSVGKSLLAAALCRIFARRGVRVAPFKAQNMSNNAAVCADGGEIGRSQALQASAAGIEPTVDMNPILLKPEADSRSQVIVNGRPWKRLGARDYFRTKETLWPVVTDALERLRSEYELVVIEGAGSPAEMNLRQVEIVNMAVARYSRAPVLLVGDIERGGVFAQLLGTIWLLGDEERSLVCGMLVNKFRGDVSLFDEGRSFLEQRGGVPVLGVIPWIPDLNLPEEDSADLNRSSSIASSSGPIDIAVIRLPRISNFDDFNPLIVEPGVTVRYVDSSSQLGNPAAVILPGTKSTMSDLDWLRRSGLAEKISELAECGTQIIGICGGYQMLGQSLHDPDGLESTTLEMPGLGLLPTVTVFKPRKETRQVRGIVLENRHCPNGRGQTVDGYEIHMGRTTGGNPWLELTNSVDDAGSITADGASSSDGMIWGCYLHGLFGNDAFRGYWLAALADRPRHDSGPAMIAASSLPGPRFNELLEESLNRLADHVEATINLQELEQIVWRSSGVSL